MPGWPLESIATWWRSPRPGSPRSLREHRWATLAVAQYRCGRQADALRSLRRARQTLVEELGIEPGRRSSPSSEPSSTRTGPPPDAGTPGDRRTLPVQGIGSLRHRRRRSLLRADRRRRGVRRTSTGQPVTGHHRSVRLWQVVDRPGRRGAGTGREPATWLSCSCQVLMRGRRRPRRWRCLTTHRCSSSTNSRSCSSSPTRPPARCPTFCARLVAYAVDVAPVVLTVRADRCRRPRGRRRFRQAGRARPASRHAAGR